jgi:hypothetical protein
VTLEFYNIQYSTAPPPFSLNTKGEDFVNILYRCSMKLKGEGIKNVYFKRVMILEDGVAKKART